MRSVIQHLSQMRLDEYANAIRRLGKRVVEDVVEVGRLLTDAKELAGHGKWLPWLKKEFDGRTRRPRTS